MRFPLLVALFSLLACAPAEGPLPSQTQFQREGLLTSLFQSVAPLPRARTVATAVLLGDGRVLALGGRNGIALSSTDLYEPFTNTWSAGPPMALPRQLFPARLLRDGSVLVFGGGLAVGATAQLELLPRGGSAFVDAGRMLDDRKDQSVSELPDGRWVVAGGQMQSSSEVLDARGGSAVRGPALGAVLGAHSEVVLPGGSVVLVGGSAIRALPLDGGPAVVLRAFPALSYNTVAVGLPSGEVVVAGAAQANGVASPAAAFIGLDEGVVVLPDLLQARYDHRGALLPSGEVLLFGGVTADGGVLGTAELWSDGGWINAGFSTARSDHMQVLLPEGQLLILGGEDNVVSLATAEVLDRVDPQIRPLPAPRERTFGCGALLPDGRFLRLGGEASGVLAPGAEVLTPGVDSWVPVASPARLRKGCAATALHDGRVLVVGGRDQNGLVQLNELYEPATNQWVFAAEGTPRERPAALTLSTGQVLVAGGRDASGTPVATAELFEPGSDRFLATAPMATARADFTLSLLADGLVLAVGGQGTGARLTSVEVFQPEGRRWTAGPPLATARAGHSATASSDGTVVVLGGEGAGSATVEVLDARRSAWLARATGLGPREGHSTVRLPFNRFLVVGAEGGVTHVDRLELMTPRVDLSLIAPAVFDEARAAMLPNGQVLLVGATTAAFFDERRVPPSRERPTLAEPRPLQVGARSTFFGTGLRPRTTGSDGVVNGSPSNHPVLLLREFTSGRVSSASTVSFSEGNFEATFPAAGLPGWYAVWVSVNGVPSAPRVTFVARACTAQDECGAGSCAADEVCCATPCARGDCATGRCLGGEPLPDAGPERVDGGLDAGGEALDGGAPRAPGPYTVGCACGAADGLVWACALLVLAAWSRRRAV